MYSITSKTDIIQALLELIEHIISDQNYESEDGFFAFIEICYGDAETVDQILEVVPGESDTQPFQSDLFHDQQPELNEHLPLSDCLIESFRNEYYKNYG